MVLNARGLTRGGGSDALILLAIEDITDRRKSEDAILAGEQQLKDLIQALPGAVYTTDAQGRIMFYNPEPSNSGDARLNLAQMNGVARGASISPTARRCRMASARWRWR